MANRIVVVSNRVAPVNEGKTAAGGLAVAVLAALRRSGGVWFGWSGEVVAAPDDNVRVTESGRLARATVDLSERDYEEYSATKRASAIESAAPELLPMET